jgi:hypothetical protein
LLDGIAPIFWGDYTDFFEGIAPIVGG